MKFGFGLEYLNNTKFMHLKYVGKLLYYLMIPNRLSDEDK